MSVSHFTTPCMLVIPACALIMDAPASIVLAARVQTCCCVHVDPGGIEADLVPVLVFEGDASSCAIDANVASANSDRDALCVVGDVIEQTGEDRHDLAHALFEVSDAGFDHGLRDLPGALR